ncbi:MAG TPA: peptidase inhibitor family I36 protein [Pseudonocardiaceae bacterium]|nr:peptidase inhibitor family I36 protein [Pseudonocardiaceae bacterium]
MTARSLGFMAVVAAIAAVGAAVTGPAAVSATPAAACSSGQICLWSGASYTGQLVVLNPEHPWEDCIQAPTLGLPAIRSAQKNGVDCQFQAGLHADGGCGQSTEPAYVDDETPTITPAALSLQAVTIPC